MKVNPKYRQSSSNHPHLRELIERISELHKTIRELVPESLDLSFELCKDCTFVNDKVGRPVVVMSTGEEMPDYAKEAFALEFADFLRKSHS